MIGEAHLVFRPDRSALAALPARYVRETMRPLPIEPLAGAPPFVVGASIVRGRAVPVIDAAALFSGDGSGARWLAIEVGERAVVLAVHEIIGVQPLERADDRAAPPLLTRAARGTIAELSSLDGELLAILRAARLVEGLTTKAEPARAP